MTVSNQENRNYCFYIQFAFATAFMMLTGGVFLSGLALYMNASDLIVSYCQVIPNLSGITILFLSFLLEKFTSKKSLTIWLTFIAKLSSSLIIFIPLAVTEKYQILVFMALVVLSYTLQALSTVSLNNWMLHFIPKSKEGRVISMRQTWSLVATVILSLSASWFMDEMEAANRTYNGYLILYLLGMVMAAAELITLLRIEDVNVITAARRSLKISDIFRLPLRNRLFMSYVVYIFMFYILLNISDSFLTVFMMKYLQLPYSQIVVFMLMMQLPQIFLFRIWGTISDKSGHKFVLFMSVWFFIGETFLFGLTDSNNYFIFVPLGYLIASVGNSGFAIALFNRRYEIIPEDGRMVYDCFYSAVIGLALLLGPFIGVSIKEGLAARMSLSGLTRFWDIRLLFFMSAAGILLLQCCHLLINKKRGKAA